MQHGIESIYLTVYVPDKSKGVSASGAKCHRDHFSPGKRTGIVRIARVCPHGDNMDTAIAIYKQIKFKLTIIAHKVYVHIHKYMYLDLTYTIATTLAADKSIWERHS